MRKVLQQCRAEHCLTCSNAKGINSEGFEYRIKFDNTVRLYGKRELVFPDKKRIKTCGDKVVRLLCVFLSTKGSVLSKQTLTDFVWKEVVSDGSLPVLINELRRILNHSSYRILTVRNEGYLLMELGKDNVK